MKDFAKTFQVYNQTVNNCSEEDLRLKFGGGVDVYRSAGRRRFSCQVGGGPSKECRWELEPELEPWLGARELGSAASMWTLDRGEETQEDFDRGS